MGEQPTNRRKTKPVFLIFFPRALATLDLKGKRNNKMFVHWFYEINTRKFPANVIAITRNFRIGLHVDTGS